MSKSNKLLLKLIKASGGWENFLYETLREVCQKVSLGSLMGDAHSCFYDAQEIIEVYEEQRGVLNSTPSKFPVADLGVQVKVNPVAPTKIIKPAAPVPVPPLQPKKMKVKVRIDTDAGWCQGGLPLPADYTIVNKGQLTVTTVSGLEMARGNDDGQVQSQDVSGQVSSKGKYRLVFKDVNLGVAYINFEVMPTPPLPAAPLRQVLAAPQQITPSMVAAREAGQAAARVASAAAAEVVEKVSAKSQPIIDVPRPDGDRATG